MKYFKNITKQDIKGKVGGKEVIIKAGQALRLDDYTAERFARAAAQRELFAKKYVEEQAQLVEGKKINGTAISKKIIEKEAQKFLKDSKEVDVVSIEDLEADVEVETVDDEDDIEEEAPVNEPVEEESDEEDKVDDSDFEESDEE